MADSFDSSTSLDIGFSMLFSPIRRNCARSQRSDRSRHRSSNHDNGEPIIGEKGVRPSSLSSLVLADIRPHSRLSCYSSLVVVESEVGRLAELSSRA